MPYYYEDLEDDVVYQPDLWNDEFINDPDWYYGAGKVYYCWEGSLYVLEVTDGADYWM